MRYHISLFVPGYDVMESIMVRHDFRAQEHIDALYSLIGYLIDRCPDQYNNEMDEQFQNVLQSFSRLADNPPKGGLPDQYLHRSTLGHNYQIALNALLMRFVHSVSTEAVSGPTMESGVAELWRHMDTLHDQFFSEPLRQKQLSE